MQVDIRTALLSMAYQEAKPGKWLKPIGFHLFIFNEGLNEWSNWFKDKLGNISLWESHKINSDVDFLSQIKDFETWTTINKCCNSDSQFQLAAVDI